ncbi:DNA mismatch repair protein [Lambiella insularis]|nr:DNA mismatch repair protein [Lambiella insularis]
MADTMDVERPGSPRGLKRKADDSRPLPQAPKRIKPLDQDVVNKIAAGEIIVAPMHALKELIENAVDAGSTSLEIVVKDGGLKLLQITDNGHGINKDDLPILCERFTTSKLKAFEDLTSIGTYGFRGEALASISHIAHLTVTTKTADSSCAWRAHYSDGKLAPAKPGQSADPKPIAGRGGTQITVEDLFYNIKQRQKAFKSHSEEYSKILDVVGRHAVHCQGVAFSCKKHGDSAMGISVPSNATTVDRIRQIYGTAVANELINFEIRDDRLGFKASGLTSNANYHVKKTTILLFINNRSVESSAIKQAIQRIYSAFLPKGGHPFLYLSLEIEPQRVDVNVHPTKREVNFLNEDEIIEAITGTIGTELSKVDTSRTFMTQSLLPGTKVPTISTPATSSRTLQASSSTPRLRNESSLVRTDPSSRKITSMLPPSATKSASTSSSHLDPVYTHNPTREAVNCRLTTVKELRAIVRANMHVGLTEVFATHTYVGLVDSFRRIVAIQSGVKLYLIDYGMVSCEYFYQVGLTDFANFGIIAFDPPLDLEALIRSAAEIERQKPFKTQTQSGEDDIPWETVPCTVTAQLVQRREMLSEYFCLDISEDRKLLGIPLLVKGYMPSLAKLPRFLLRLGPYVDWMNEQRCFQTFLGELASFYAPEQLPNTDRPSKGKGKSAEGDSAARDLGEGAVQGAKDVPDDSEELAHRREQLERMLEHVLFPAFRARLVATKDMLQGVVEVADLKGLYKVFERC